jgi:hypothetical protein
MDSSMTPLTRRALSRLAMGTTAAVALGRLPATSATAALSEPGTVRALGAFVHEAPGYPVALDAFAQRVGRMPAIVCWYEAWSKPEPGSGDVTLEALLAMIAERDAVPLITWEPWDPAGGVDQPAYRLGVIANGDFDAYIDAWAARLAAYPGPIFLRFAHELNAPWYPWGIGVNGNTAEDSVAAWKHLRERFAVAGADNVHWVWSVDATAIEAQPLAAAYPGDAAVDWIAMGGFNWGTSMPETSWRSLEEIFAPAYEAIGSLTSRPLMILEVACADDGGDKAAWITEGFAAIPERFPRVEAVCWFNEEGKIADWRVESSPEALAAFAAVARDPAWQGTLGDRRDSP